MSFTAQCNKTKSSERLNPLWGTKPIKGNINYEKDHLFLTRHDDMHGL